MGWVVLAAAAAGLGFLLFGGGGSRATASVGAGRRVWGVRGEETLSAEEHDAIGLLARDLGIEPRWLLGVMAFESQLNPAARNKITRATGLIQFMPDTARQLGTTVDALLLMSRLEQLPYVRAFFMRGGWGGGKLRSYLDTYLAVFWPAGVGGARGDDYVLFREGSAAYKANAGLDRDKNGTVTRGDVRQRISGVLVSPAPEKAPTPTAADVIVAMGDSIGYGIGEQLLAHRAGVKNSAVVGSFVRSVKASDPAVLGAHVILATATNDLATARPLEDLAGELEQLEAELRSRAASVRVLLPLHPGAIGALRTRAPAFAKLVRERGKIPSAELVTDPTPTADRTADGIHYTSAGYRRLATLLGGGPLS